MQFRALFMNDHPAPARGVQEGLEKAEMQASELEVDERQQPGQGGLHGGSSSASGQVLDLGSSPPPDLAHAPTSSSPVIEDGLPLSAESGPVTEDGKV